MTILRYTGTRVNHFIADLGSISGSIHDFINPVCFNDVHVGLEPIDQLKGESPVTMGLCYLDTRL